MLAKLRADHGYVFAALRSKAERSTTTFKRSPDGTFVMTPAVCVRLVVPMNSAFGKGILASRKKAEQEKARSLAAKSTGGWIRPNRTKARALASKARRQTERR